MKYKIKNVTTGEETICEKVVVDNYDYYLSKNPELDDYCYNPRTKEFFKVLDTMMIDGLNKNNDDYKVIATTNKSLNLPMVIDEVEELAEIDTDKCLCYKYPNSDNGYYDHIEGFKSGYNKAKETYSYTKEDMVEFAKWYQEENHESKAEQYFGFSDLDMLAKWQEQRTIEILVK